MPRPALGSALLVTASCASLPLELNLSPFYRHRLDADRSLLELDVAWPIVHYEKTPTGGDDLRIRPLWRRVVEGERVEHQFLWPFGRSVSDGEEVDTRLFPLFTYRWRLNAWGQHELEWEAPYPLPILPFVAGGTEAYEDGTTESYFGFHPIYADLRGYITYDRFRSILFPLYLGTERGTSYSHNFLFWLIGFGGRTGTFADSWHRVLPLYAAYDRPGVRNAYTVLWPFLTWGEEDLNTDDPIGRFMLWPLYGGQRSVSGKVHGWSVAWPLFQSLTIEGRYRKLDLLWPIFRYIRDDHEDRPFTQWWFWPLLSRTEGRYHQAWSILWPILWWEWFQDPDGDSHKRQVLPFYWHFEQYLKDGRTATWNKLWPFCHVGKRADDTGEWSVLSVWPWREGNAYGVDETYGFLWTLAAGKRYSAGDHGMHLFANLYTTRERAGRRYASVPFLFSYEGDDRRGTLRLFQCIPIQLGGAEPGR